MTDNTRADYSAFDHPDILSVLFHPRKEGNGGGYPAAVTPVTIPVEEGETIGAAFHAAGRSAPIVLFFHGNGEIVADYNEIGRIFTKQRINFFPVDYRGYGRSSGVPTVSSMMTDCHAVFDYAKGWLADSGYTGDLIVMGRSLGSASALEIAATRETEIRGLIIESGFAYALPLLELIGVDTGRLGLTEEKGFRNIDKAARCRLPVLVIHAEHDHIIPFSDGRALFERCPASDKYFVTIYGADHNTIFYHGIDDYLSGIVKFASSLARISHNNFD